MDYEGCHVEVIDDVGPIMAWIEGEGARPKLADQSMRWALIHEDDGVIWGRLDDEWILSSSSYPEISPQFHPAEVQQLRLFGERSEILIWRTGKDFRGRIAEDSPATPEASTSGLEPSDEDLILLADYVRGNNVNGFTVVVSASGMRQALPFEVKAGADGRVIRASQPKLHVRNYFSADEKSGELTLALSRFVSVGGAI